MKLHQYLDSTYLKTAEQAAISETENLEVVKKVVREAIHEGFKLVMVRPEMVTTAKSMVTAASSNVLVGTVINFPEGKGTIQEKLEEATTAINNSADELDFVVNYTAFKLGETTTVKNEVLACTQLGLQHEKVVKWIIEVAALTNQEIVRLTALIKNVVLSNFKEEQYQHVFVKSSTGFYITTDGKPNGATIPTITLMLENAFPLPVKAAGGVRTYKEAMTIITLGVKRIGTSSALAIANDGTASSDY
ncbi:deoxyribose-phosphate aldolase [Flavobacterium litorale]|uniref:Deoxyribose-phosphate aldolase n=1 Tax=Flavobacterium litorale TaxID=2856519 RepID=A0ABX8V9I5_9FLAO|nr:deoxyribose-phosphate aldolase [Flavobacterium litorale]QYJ69387.1 deoxyribose-phosphate aldolase [Flavobacterium litorale]